MRVHHHDEGERAETLQASGKQDEKTPQGVVGIGVELLSVVLQGIFVVGQWQHREPLDELAHGETQSILLPSGGSKGGGGGGQTPCEGFAPYMSCHGDCWYHGRCGQRRGG